jgi:hypothetical protein
MYNVCRADVSHASNRVAAACTGAGDRAAGLHACTW